MRGLGERIMKLLNALLVTAALGVSAAAFAGHGPHPSGPQGFDNPNVGTVAAVSKNAYDDQWVTLRGCLTNYLGHERYEFTDATGSIEVELDDDRDWSFVSKGQLIDIVGKVDKDFLSTTIEVKNIVPIERGGAQAPAPRGPQGM